MYLFESQFCLDMWPGVELLDLMAVLFLGFFFCFVLFCFVLRKVHTVFYSGYATVEMNY